MAEMNKKISKNYQPSVFWSFNDALEKEELGWQLEQLLGVGCSGGFMHSRVGLVTEYMSDEWMDAVQYCCEQARNRNTTLWLYDEDRFPSGYAGGAVLNKDDSLRTKALCLIEKEQEDNYNILQIYKTISEQGKDYLLALCGAKDGNMNFEGKCYVDLLNPRTVEVFIEETHEKYLEAVGEYFGKEIKGIFSDEFCYTQKTAFPCFSVPFTNGLEQDFEKKYGYNLVDCMESLFWDKEGYQKIRRDFYEFLTVRFIESFTKPYNEWCKKNGLIFTGHLLNEDFLTTQPEWTGAVMPHYMHMEMPGVDKLGSDRNYLLTVKQLTSASEQLGKRSLCEAYGCSGHQFGPDGIKRVADWLCVLGINFINPHLTLYSVRGERKRDCPPDLSWRQPWFKVGRGCFDHIARVCELMDSKKVYTDVLVIHPIQSVWAEYSPLHKPNPVYSIWTPKNENAGQNFITETECYQKPFLDLSNQLLSAGINYHYGDEMIIREHGSYEDGIIIGQCQYRKVIVPPVSVLRKETIQLIEKMAAQYGKNAVIFIHKIPECVPESMHDKVTLVKDVRAAIAKLSKEYKRPVEIRNIYSGQIAEQIYYRYSEDVKGRKTVFVVNTSEERGFDLRVTLPFETQPAILDTVTGVYWKAPGVLKNGEFVCQMHLKKGGSAMFIAEDITDMQEASNLQCGVSFREAYKLVNIMSSPTYQVDDFNVLPLHIVDYKTTGKELLQQPIEAIWYKAFYNLENGTPFEAEYRFSIAQMPKKVIALIEMARNLDDVLVNGISVKSSLMESKQKYFDKSYDEVVLENLHLGENSIRIQGRTCNNISGVGSHKRIPMGTIHKPTELESIMLLGDFGVAAVGNGQYEIVHAPNGLNGSVTKSLYPFYTGSLTCKLQLESDVRLLRVDAKAQAVELCINGESRDVAYLHPFEFEVTKHESKDIEIRLYNSLENTFGPLHLGERDKLSMVGPSYFSDMRRYTNESILFDYGLWSISQMK